MLISFSDSGNFVNAGEPLDDFLPAVLTQSDQPLLNGVFLDFVGTGLIDAKLAYAAVSDEKFKDPDPPDIAGSTTVSTAVGFEECLGERGGEVVGEFFVNRLVGDFALRTEDANQPLGHDSFDRTCDEVGFDSHIDEACEGSRGIVGMQGAEDHVACQRSLNRAFGSFSITDFSDEDDIGIVSEDAS